MSELLTSKEAAEQLGISVTTLYDWLGRSRCGELVIRGRGFTIDYLQGGSRGQGRIRIEANEVERIKEAMRVKPMAKHVRRPPSKHRQYPGITVPLGRPTD